jgi:hypothetical protein
MSLLCFCLVTQLYFELIIYRFAGMTFHLIVFLICGDQSCCRYRFFFLVLPFSIFLPRLFLRKLLLWQLNVINSECVRVEIFCSSGCAHVLLVFACCFCLWWMTARGILYFSVILDSTFVKVFVTSWLIDWQWWPWRLMRGWYIELYGLVWYGR